MIETQAAGQRTLVSKVRSAVVRRWHILTPAAIAAALRLPAVFNGLPFVSHPDEPTNYGVFHDMVSARTPLPHFYNYPSLLFDLEAAAHGLVLGFEKLFVGGVQSFGMVPGGGWGANVAESRLAWIIARLLVLTISVVGVVLAVRLTESLTQSRIAAFAAGLMAALSTISVASGSVITPDALAGTLALAAMASTVRVFRLTAGDDRGLRRWALLTGALLGLAVSAKYNTVVLALPIAVTLALVHRPMRLTWQHTTMIATAAIAAFVVATPGCILDSTRFLHDLRFEIDHYRTGHLGAEGNSFTSNLRFLWSSDGVAVAIALVGLALRRTRASLVLASWPVLYLLTIGFAKVRFARNLSPIVGVVAVLAACGANEVCKVLRRRPVWAIAAVLLVVPAFMQLRTTVDALHKDLTDHQAAARTWLTAHVPEGQTVLAEFHTPWLDRQRWQVTNVGSSLDEVDAASDYDVVILTSGGVGRFLKDPSRYPDQVQQIADLRDQACRTEHYEDDFGYWVDVLVMSCSSDEG